MNQTSSHHLSVPVLPQLGTGKFTARGPSRDNHALHHGGQLDSVIGSMTRSRWKQLRGRHRARVFQLRRYKIRVVLIKRRPLAIPYTVNKVRLPPPLAAIANIA